MSESLFDWKLCCQVSALKNKTETLWKLEQSHLWVSRWEGGTDSWFLLELLDVPGATPAKDWENMGLQSDTTLSLGSECGGGEFVYKEWGFMWENVTESHSHSLHSECCHGCSVPVWEGSCTWQSPVLQNVISLTHFWAGSDLCSILRCWLSLWRALSVWEATCEKSPAGFREKLIVTLRYLPWHKGKPLSL